MTFNHFTMHHSILKAITEDGYQTPTPIQEAAIPKLLEGHDLLGCAQTGTGKTAAFALPIIHHIVEEPNHGRERHIQALILTPTRELALQIKESFDTYSRKNHVKAIAVYGGMSKRNQIIKIKRGVDVLIATPGRLLDLMQMKIVKLNHVRFYVLDEADQMLDMGFIDDVKKITSALPSTRQTMLFSATIPEAIERLASSLLKQPIRLEMAPQNTPLETVTQTVFFAPHNDKLNLLMDTFRKDDVTSALVFVRTKRYCDIVVKQLSEAGFHVGALHGDKSQSQRQQVLAQFKAKQLHFLIATDVAARGIDIDTLSHVINMDMPQTPETYLHRIGRTARAGKLGAAYSFCASDEKHLLKAIQKHIGFVLPVEGTHAFTETTNTRKKASKNYNGIQQPKQVKRASDKFVAKDPYQTRKPKKKKPFYAENKKYSHKTKRYATS